MMDLTKTPGGLRNITPTELWRTRSISKSNGTSDRSTSEGVAPFFVVGCPRSGTTLLQVMLNRHPAIHIPPELKLFCSYHMLPRWIRQKTIDRIRHDLGITLSLPLEAKTRTDEVYQVIWRELRKQDGRLLHFGDKTPEYVYRIDWVTKVFPTSKFVFVYRDPRDVSLSLTRQPWLKCDLQAAAKLWVFSQKRLLTAAQRIGSHVHWVRYEELVTSPVRVLRSVLCFLDKKLHETDLTSLLVPSNADSKSFPSRENDWKSRALRPIDSERLNVWRHVSKEDILRIESQCWDVMQHFGYQPSFSSNPMNWARSVDGSLRLASTFAGLPKDCWIAELIHRVSNLQCAIRGGIP